MHGIFRNFVKCWKLFLLDYLYFAKINIYMLWHLKVFCTKGNLTNTVFISFVFKCQANLFYSQCVSSFSILSVGIETFWIFFLTHIFHLMPYTYFKIKKLYPILTFQFYYSLFKNKSIKSVRELTVLWNLFQCYF